MEIDFTELSSEDRNYFKSKFDVEIQELNEDLKNAKAKFTVRLQKSNLNEDELELLEETVQKAQSNLDFLTNSNAPADLISDQQLKLEESQNALTEKKRKTGIVSDRAAVLEQIDIKEIELQINLRQEKLTELEALG